MQEHDCPTVSVVLPTFNRANTLARAVRSVVEQSYHHWELILVDDGSTDHTELVIRNFADPRVRYSRHEKNRGHSAARNTGIRAARGVYVAFLDSDDEWLPEKLAREVSLFESQGRKIGLVYSGEKVISSDGRVLKVEIPVRSGNVYGELLAEDFIGSCSAVSVRKEILDTVGNFDESLRNCVDWDLWLRIAKTSEVAFVPECLMIRHLGSDQVSGSLANICEGRTSVVQKYRDEMTPAVLGQHLGRLAIILLNYDKSRAQTLALAALRYQWLQPKLVAALLASLLGTRSYRYMFSKVARAWHKEYIGNAKI